MEFSLYPTDETFPESSWIEAVDCFNAATDILLEFLSGRTITKDNPDLVHKLKEELTEE